MTVGTAISTTMKQVGAGSASAIWGVDASQHIWKYTGSGTSWTQISGSLKQVNPCADGSTWGVNSANQIYSYQGGNAWAQISGSLAQISAGSASLVWGVNSANQVYRYLGGNAWTQMASGPTQVSVGADGTVWGVNASSGVTYQYNGNNGWTQLPGNTGCGQLSTETGPFSLVAVGSSTFIRALDPAGHVYTWYGSSPWSCEGIIDPGVTCISFAADGTFVFIDSTGTTWLVPYDPTPPAG